MGLLRTAISKTFKITQKRVDLNDRTVFVSIRWLVFLGLVCLALYNVREVPSIMPFAIAAFYGLSNLILAILVWTKRYPFPGSAIVIFLVDVVLITAGLYTSVGLDSDLYLICFLIIYLSTLGRNTRDAIGMAIVAMLLYLALIWRQDPDFDFMDSRFLLRFPFLFILSLFTSYLCSEVEKSKRKVSQLEVLSSSLQNERDKVLGELDKKEAELIQAEKLSAMGHMAGAMAHEIRNPLCVILGYTSEMLATTEKEHTHHRFLEVIQRCANRCNELAEKLLRFSRQPKENEPYALKEAVEEAVSLARLGRKSFNIRTHLELNHDATILGRRNELQQIIVNLCTNAIDAMPNGGTLTVQTFAEERANNPWASIQIQDTGMGIPAEFLKQIFNPFFTTKPAGVGTGLGLSIVKDILRASGGTIDVDSTVGKGTIFTVRIPATTSKTNENAGIEAA